MEALMETGAVILGILLRLGIPILVTLAFVWLLRRLDARWQLEASAGRHAAVKEMPIFGDLRCWITNDCTPEQRERCPAFIEAVRPCWQVFRDNGAVKQECLNCEVFHNAPIAVPA